MKEYVEDVLAGAKQGEFDVGVDSRDGTPAIWDPTEDIIVIVGSLKRPGTLFKPPGKPYFDKEFPGKPPKELPW